MPVSHHHHQHLHVPSVQLIPTTTSILYTHTQAKSDRMSRMRIIRGPFQKAFTLPKMVEIFARKILLLVVTKCCHRYAKISCRLLQSLAFCG